MKQKNALSPLLSDLVLGCIVRGFTKTVEVDLDVEVKISTKGYANGLNLKPSIKSNVIRNTKTLI